MAHTHTHTHNNKKKGVKLIEILFSNKRITNMSVIWFGFLILFTQLHPNWLTERDWGRKGEWTGKMYSPVPVRVELLDPVVAAILLCRPPFSF